jgi:hypothetical protein
MGADGEVAFFKKVNSQLPYPGDPGLDGGNASGLPCEEKLKFIWNFGVLVAST